MHWSAVRKGVSVVLESKVRDSQTSFKLARRTLVVKMASLVLPIGQEASQIFSHV